MKKQKNAAERAAALELLCNNSLSKHYYTTRLVKKQILRSFGIDEYK